MVRGKRHLKVHLLYLAEKSLLHYDPRAERTRIGGGAFGPSKYKVPTSGNTACWKPLSRDLFQCRCRSVGGTLPCNEVMLNDFNCSCPIYIACGYTDLRRGIDGLASIVEAQFKMDPFQNAMFLFCGRRRDRLKALYWEGDGFLLLYKRLEQGSFQWPRTQKEVQTLTPQQYRWLMEGLKIEQPKANKAISGVSMT